MTLSNKINVNFNGEKNITNYLFRMEAFITKKVEIGKNKVSRLFILSLTSFSFFFIMLSVILFVHFVYPLLCM